jgi:hypothetical protein
VKNEEHESLSLLGSTAKGNDSGSSPVATPDERREWLIWNADYQQFWGPNSGGYFGLWGAGLYTETEAKSLSRNKDRRDQPQHISEYRDQIENMRGAFERLKTTLTRSDVARGIQCINYSPPWFKGHWRDWHRGHGCHLDDGKPRRAHAVAEIAAHGDIQAATPQDSEQGERANQKRT